MISASWGVVLGHICFGGTPPPPGHSRPCRRVGKDFGHGSPFEVVGGRGGVRKVGLNRAPHHHTLFPHMNFCIALGCQQELAEGLVREEFSPPKVLHVGAAQNA